MTKDTKPWRQVVQSEGAKGPSEPFRKITLKYNLKI